LTLGEAVRAFREPEKAVQKSQGIITILITQMIVDTLQNAHLYQSINEGFRKAFDYLTTTDFSKTATGKYKIEGDDIFAIVNEYETKDKKICEIEAHKKHIDIQYLVAGTEMFGYAPLTNQLPTQDYDELHDVAIYKESVSYIKLEAGMFIIFFPTDLHQPEVSEFEPLKVKKVVVKIKI